MTVATWGWTIWTTWTTWTSSSPRHALTFVMNSQGGHTKEAHPRKVHTRFTNKLVTHTRRIHTRCTQTQEIHSWGTHTRATKSRVADTIFPSIRRAPHTRRVTHTRDGHTPGTRTRAPPNSRKVSHTRITSSGRRTRP